MISLSSILVGVVSVAIGAHYTELWTLPTRGSSIQDETERFSCRPFLPNLFAQSPPQRDHPEINNAARRLEQFLDKRFKQGDIDSLSVAVVSSAGPLFEKNYGVMRGNESASSLSTHSHSIYRIASVSKLFLVLQGYILAEKGIISWEDPVEKYLPDFKYPPRALNSLHQNPITLLQLSTHMSGLGYDPPANVSNWPHDLTGAGPLPRDGVPFPDHAALFDLIGKHQQVYPSNAYPMYSNMGTGLLGLALVAANRMANGPGEPATYAELVKRDIFDTLGMNGSHFLTTEANKHLTVVPSLAPEIADEDFLDAMNPPGGQFSSLQDCITAIRTLLNPNLPQSLITSASMRKWLHAVHTFEEDDDWTGTGQIWEITKAKDSNGRPRKNYWKLGAMAGYHSAVAIHPGTSYGVVVMMGGHYPDAAKLTYDTFEIFQPAIDAALAELSVSLYAGDWASEDLSSSASIVVQKGVLYIDRLVLKGVDVLAIFNSPHRLALRWMEREDEFRIDIGVPHWNYNGKKHLGCFPYWGGLDIWGHRNGSSLNLIKFAGKDRGRLLHVPAADVHLKRI